MPQKIKFRDVVNITVIVAALGYFVDVYDLVLFLIIGRRSLQDLIPGIGEGLEKNFDLLLNIQMTGMLIGGILWGVLGDKKGRLSVLFGSILMYSLANIANGLMANVKAEPDTIIFLYGALRLIAGIGLAGELGAGITLVSEIMSKETRGYGTMIVASVGVLGAVVAGLIGGSETISWEITYYIGGGLGLTLLLMRIGVFESGMFENVKAKEVTKGNFFQLFTNKKRAFKYINCILIGLPVWYIIGILIGKGPLIAKVLGVNGAVVPGNCVMLCYSGLVFGDICSGGLSQFLKSRKKIFYIFYTLAIVLIAIYLSLHNVSNVVFYSLVFALGFSVGFWAVLVTVGAEQFGTNMRATAATTIPNFVRGSLVPVTAMFWYFWELFKPSDYAIVYAAMVVTAIVMTISFVSLYFLAETFGKDLDYLEGEKIFP